MKKEVQIIRVQHKRRPRHDACLSKQRRNNFATRHGALDQTSKTIFAIDLSVPRDENCNEAY